MKKLLHRFEYPWQAEIVQNLLAEKQVEVSAVKGAREYASILTGIGQSPIELYVEQSQWEAAEAVLNRYLQKANLSVVDAYDVVDEKKPEKSYYRTTIFLSIAGGIVVPILFNILATYYYFKFLKQKESFNKKLLALAILIVGWLEAVAVVYHFLKNR